MSSHGTIGWLRALAQPVTYLGAAMLAFVYAALVYLIVADRKLAYDDAARDAGNLVRILDKSISNILTDADGALQYLRKSYVRDPDNFDLAAAANDPAFKTDVTLHFTIIGADGRVKDSSFSKHVIGADRTDRESVQIHFNSTSDDVFVSKPLVARSSGRDAIVLTRRITMADGQFGGVIVVLLDPNQLGAILRSPDLGPDGSVALIGLDGVIRLRAVDGELSRELMGRELPLNAGLLLRAVRTPSDIYWNTPGIFDNVKRLVSYRVLESFPLVAAVTFSKSHVYRNADKNARIYLTIAAALTIAILVAIGFGAARERQLIAATEEMKAADNALRRSEERYELVEDAVDDGIWDWTPATNEAYMSPRWKAILGFADDEVPNTFAAFQNRLHPDDVAVVQASTEVRLAHPDSFSVEFRLRHKDGSYRWVLSRGKAIRDADGRPVRLLGTINDITDQKQARERLREQATMLDLAQVIGRELDGRIVTWNTAATKFYGWSADETIGRISHELFQTRYPMPLAQINAELQRTGRWSGEVEQICKDGRRVSVASLWVLHMTRSTRPPLVIETNIDVAARKHTVAELARANLELETRVKLRTAELAREMRRREEAQQTLAQMQKMEAIGQLTAGIAHDFNNLLAVIMGSLEFVEAAAARGIPAEPELLEAAMRSGRRGRELVQRLLSFARQMPVKPEPAPVNQLILDTLRILQRTLGGAITIETKLTSDPAMILVDRNQFSNALVNLALNARDAMPEGGELTITTTRQPAKWLESEGQARWPTGDEVCIVIRDTGTGMTDEVRKRAFEPFFTTKQDGLGSGLGLSMVHGFVEQAGGHIEIKSKPGQGTRLTIRLPRIDAESRVAEAETADADAAIGNEKIVLLVEDDPDVRIVTAAQLKQLGYTVHAVANGVEAINMIESPGQIDLTLTDIVLPGGIDGLALVKEAVRSRPRMGILCMSGYAPAHRHSAWLKQQNIGVLGKPFTIAQLARALDAATPSDRASDPPELQKLSA
jgi:PAS domain S-box-containing protein